ncbi:Metallo-dependent phosphatase-like protein [Desarmillaria tabescens]|uniref:Metallo-dependent phosphatase-like protein n=1 Tax=Armillaria tabescens TaxID=1929756 RepID=A0AA39TRZ8_ARMTA|nr:Metallo-dependent phosphatase-like protein [Desarmillaria tabescens]KAK0468387.1 Metallo-dependent phosphatase-like protein [Desarmillaria tabescens]
MFALNVLLVLTLALAEVFSAPTQTPFQVPATKPRQLHGRFLQITDIHPDPYYKAHKSQSKACHRNKPKKKKNRSNYYGTPYSLTNFTLDFLDKHWASDIDFVVWTGDNARHDNDRKLPRTPSEIYDLNSVIAKRMEEIFSSRGIPVIPSLGNNDVWPHNILTPGECRSMATAFFNSNIVIGPNSITNQYSSIWKPFIPFPYHQVFQRGAYYSVEVVPNALAVISLNTMYFYDSNKAVGGCLTKEPDDPGNLQFDWLEVQLKLYRARNMQVWLTGHVPPSSGNFFPECYVRYVDLSLRFQDTILGHLYGHMNADHFFFVEAIDLEFDLDRDSRAISLQNGDLCDALLEDFSALPKPSRTDLDNYGVINVSPPVVPNPYLPTFRIFSYNVTGFDASAVGVLKKDRKHSHHRGEHGNKDELCKEEPYRSSWKCQLNSTWHSDPDSPSRRNQLWSPLGYAQYYIPDLADGNKTHKPHFKLEYTTYSPLDLHPATTEEDGEFVYPIPLGNLPKSLRKGPVEKSEYTPYGMRDLTIGSWVELARRLANGKENKLRKRFREFMYIGGE